MIQDPIPYVLGQYAVFSDTLSVDDTTEVLNLTKPEGTTESFVHGQLTRVVNTDGSVTYSIAVLLSQRGQWTGQFAASSTNANVAPLQAYVAL